MRLCARHISLLLATICSIAPALASSTTDSGTLQVGRKPLKLGPLCINHSGYNNGLVFGSYSPTSLTGGGVVGVVADVQPCNIPVGGIGNLVVQGFTSDPGTGWLISITCNGVTKTPTSATYTWDGTASWVWGGGFGFTTLPVGTNVSCTIEHN